MPRFSLTLKKGPVTLTHIIGPDVKPLYDEVQHLLFLEAQLERLFGVRAHVSSHPTAKCPECDAVIPVRFHP